jgi:hypothetical protein
VAIGVKGRGRAAGVVDEHADLGATQDHSLRNLALLFGREVHHGFARGRQHLSAAGFIEDDPVHQRTASGIGHRHPQAEALLQPAAHDGVVFHREARSRPRRRCGRRPCAWCLSERVSRRQQTIDARLLAHQRTVCGIAQQSVGREACGD